MDVLAQGRYRRREYRPMTPIANERSPHGRAEEGAILRPDRRRFGLRDTHRDRKATALGGQAAEASQRPYDIRCEDKSPPIEHLGVQRKVLGKRLGR